MADYDQDSFLNDYDEKVIALAEFLDIDLEPDFDSYVDEDATEEEQEEQRAEAIESITFDLDGIREEWGGLFSYGRSKYYVYTDSEADDAWEEALDNYIDEVILPEIPEAYQNYFDEESWKQDARYNGRGHILAGYDGDENEVEVNGTTYYIYRQN